MKIRFFVFGLLISLSSYGQGILREPYLQSATQTSVIIKWRSNSTKDFNVKIGINADALQTFIIKKPTINNEVQVDKLIPNTKYYYSISNQELSTVSGSFYTLPKAASTQKMEFVIFGDCGTNTVKQREVLSAVKSHFEEQRIDGVLLLGDNAYAYGHDEEYQNNFFNIYQDQLLKNTVLWPTPGNHDYADRTGPNLFGNHPPYFDIFSLPTNGQSGGLASNTESYYYFDIGNIHFVSLDSYGRVNDKRMSDLLGAQAVWLQNDLSQNKQDWTVVYFHHPPFSKGSHDSDKEQELIDIRNNLVPIFDKYNVDLVMNGHSHNYERSYLLNGFSGVESSFSLPKHALSSTSGKYNGENNSCPYVKSKKGTVYLVAGVGGWVGGTSEGYPHNAMHYSSSTETGAIILSVENNKLDSKFLSSQGVVLDNFVIMKNVNKSSEYVINCGEGLGLKTSWDGSAVWNNKLTSSNFKIDSLVNDTLLIATDTYVCLTDTFRVNVNPYPVPSASSNSPVLETNDLNLFSTYKGKGSVKWTGPNDYTSLEENPVIPMAKRSYGGNYNLSASYKSCLSSTQISVEIIPLLGIEKNDLKATFIAFPNPINSLLIINLNAPKTEEYTFKFFNLKGQLLFEKSMNLQANSESKIKFNISKFSNEKMLILKAESSHYQHEQLISFN
jgi:hypothetical protein